MHGGLRVAEPQRRTDEARDEQHSHGDDGDEEEQEASRRAEKRPRRNAAPDSAVIPASIRIPTRSSMTRTERTSSRSRPVTPFSSNAFAMMVVLEMATIAPVYGRQR